MENYGFKECGIRPGETEIFIYGIKP